MKSTPRNDGYYAAKNILYYLLLLTGFFLLLEISFFIQCNKAYLADFSYVSGQLQIPFSIIPGILFFLCAQLLMHVGFCMLVFFIAWYGGRFFKFTAEQTFSFAIVIWMLGFGAVMAANQAYFPHSKFSELTSLIFMTPDLAKSAALFLSSAFLLALMIGSVEFFLSLKRIAFKYVALSAVVLGFFVFKNLSMHFEPSAATAARPNVIIIGVDSLRPDFLGFFGADHLTPTFDSLLNQATVFSEAMTPLARTFPSWMSILTGEHPRVSGIRSNLVNISHNDFTNSLPAIFKKHGYETIYATDETRFSNIEARIGFTRIISPPVGLNDFLLGTFNDFPLSNLMVNTKLGRWLFPYSYANRPAFHVYQPDSFIALVRASLLDTEHKPLFLAAHFCLPHSPYLWADAMNHQSPQARYAASVQRVDQQIKSFLNLLQEAHLLDHAVVVLLSDHGEALELDGDRITDRDQYLGAYDKGGAIPRFYPPSLDDEDVNQSAGHGTDVLGLAQYHSLLAFKLYGMGVQRVSEVAGVISLSDIKNTLLALTLVPNKSNIAAAIIRGNRAELPATHLMLESDFSPASIRTVYPETRDVMMEGVHLYEINPRTTRLTIKAEMGEKIIRSKQYADIYGDWMLAFYPQNDHFHQPILINLQSGKWTNDLTSNFARRSPAKLMTAQLKRLYGIELQDI